MRPDDSFAVGTVEIEEPFESIEHMFIAKVPRIDGTVIHEAIVALGVGDQPSILHSIEETIAVARGILDPALQHVAEHSNRLFLTVSVTAAQYSAAVGCRLLLPRSQASVSLPRRLGHRGINFVQVIDDSIDRREHAIEIEPMKADVAFGI